MRRREATTTATTTAAPTGSVGVLLVLNLLVLLVLCLLVRHLLVSDNFDRSRTQPESNSVLAARLRKLTNVRCTTTVARRPNDLPFNNTTAAATR